MTLEEAKELMRKRGFSLAAEYTDEQMSGTNYSVLQDLQSGVLFLRDDDEPCESWRFDPLENVGNAIEDVGWAPWTWSTDMKLNLSMPKTPVELVIYIILTGLIGLVILWLLVLAKLALIILSSPL